MNKVAAILCLFLAASPASSLTLDHFKIVREGGGAIVARVYKTDQGPEIAVESCSLHDVDVVGRVEGVDVIAETEAILSGRAIIASDESPSDPMLSSGTWRHLVYPYRPSQGYGGSGSDQGAEKKVQLPIIIIKNEVSSVLDSLEGQAQKLCH